MYDDKEHICRDLRYLMTKILYGRELYFDRNYYLNSEGRKIFIEIARLINKCFPHYRDRMRDLRKNPSIENIAKFAEELYGSEIIEKIFCGPYIYDL